MLAIQNDIKPCSTQSLLQEEINVCTSLSAPPAQALTFAAVVSRPVGH